MGGVVVFVFALFFLVVLCYAQKARVFLFPRFQTNLLLF